MLVGVWVKWQCVGRGGRGVVMGGNVLVGVGERWGWSDCVGRGGEGGNGMTVC